MSGAVGVLNYPWGEDYGVGRLRRKRPRRLYRSMLVYRANPRDPAYMEALFGERFPAGELVRGDDDWRARLAAANRIVLLYPDSIGLGFGRFERAVLAAAGGRGVEVLNGRRRQFALDGATRRGLRLRRALERTFLLEAVGLTLLAAATPVLLAIDLVRGRT
jgi:hypothetical protein